MQESGAVWVRRSRGSRSFCSSRDSCSRSKWASPNPQATCQTRRASWSPTHSSANCVRSQSVSVRCSSSRSPHLKRPIACNREILGTTRTVRLRALPMKTYEYRNGGTPKIGAIAKETIYCTVASDLCIIIDQPISLEVSVCFNLLSWFYNQRGASCCCHSHFHFAQLLMVMALISHRVIQLSKALAIAYLIYTFYLYSYCITRLSSFHMHLFVNNYVIVNSISSSNP